MYQTKQQKNRSQIYTQLMNFDDKGKSQSISAKRQPVSFCARMVSKLCPCFPWGPTKKTAQDDSKNHEQTKSNLNPLNARPNQAMETRKDELVTVETLIAEGNRKKPTAFTSLHQINLKLDEDQAITMTTIKKWHSYPISSLKEGQLLLIGNPGHKMLCKIKSVMLEPTSQAKNLIKKSKTNQKPQTHHPQSYIDKYWNKRYALFTKFDQGISIHESSWPVLVPEAVSDYVAGLIKCQAVLNLYCGVGGDAIKLANTCKKVYAWDPNPQNLRCLHINAKVYSTENIQIISQLQTLKNTQIQTAVVSFPYKLHQQCLNQSTPLSLQTLIPTLTTLLQTSLTHTPNTILILPPNINPTQLTTAISSQLQQTDILPESCCLKVEKIYYGGQLRYIVVGFGGVGTGSVAINDQLEWIYGRLGLNLRVGKAEKRLVKKLRETYGMVVLLNHVISSSQLTAGQPIGKLLQYITQHNLLPEQKLTKYIQQRDHQIRQAIAHTSQPSSQHHQERTVSQFSIPSMLNRVSTDQLHYEEGEGEEDGDACRTVPMGRESIKPRSMIRSIGVSKKMGEDPNIRESIVTRYKQSL